MDAVYADEPLSPADEANTNVNVNVDVAALVKTLSEEVARWYDRIVTSGAEQHRLLPRHERVRIGTPIDIVLDRIDDSAVLFFNGYNLGHGDAGKPIVSRGDAKVRAGSNLVAFNVQNQGLHRWSFHLDVRPSGHPDPIFRNGDGTDDGFANINRFYFLHFIGF